MVDELSDYFESESVYAIAETLPNQVQPLLERFSSTLPPFTPNYVGFIEHLAAILKPVLEYADAEFHQGTYDEVQVAKLAYRKLAELKWNIGQRWRR